MQLKCVSMKNNLRHFYITFFLLLFSMISYGQLPKWILGNSQQFSSGSFYPLTSGNLSFYEVDFTNAIPSVTNRSLGASVNSIVSMGSQDVINNALDSTGNILFYLFSASRTAYNDFFGTVSDTVYFVAPNLLTGLDEVFGKVSTVNRISSVIEHGLCPRPNYPGQYYFIYKTRYGSNTNDDVKYVIIDGINKTVSAPITLISNERTGEGFTISKSNCANDKHWLFTTRLESNGFVSIRRSEINSTGISSTSNLYTVNLTNNSGAGVVTALEMSSQGDRLAVCLFSSSSSNKAVSIFDFDVNTGAISNERFYTNSGGGIVTCEFSPDGSRIYLLQGGSSSFPNVVYACPVIATGSYVVSSANLLAGVPVNGSLAMELAYDGKIYINKGHNQSSFYCITNPNSLTPNIISTANPFLGSSTYRIGDAFPDQIDGEYLNSSLNMSIIASSDSICEGQSCLLFANGATNYVWSGGNINSVNDSVVVSPLVTTTYYLFASNGNCQKTDSITIVVNPNPIAVITGDSVICSGESTLLNAFGGTMYFWSGGITSNLPSISVAPIQTTSYYVQVSDGNCINYDTIQVVVNSLPISVVSPDDTICQGESVTLSASGGTTYQWSGGVNDNSASITVSPLTSTNYYVEISNGICIQQDTVYIFVDTALIPLISGPSNVCFGQSITLTALGGLGYTWSGGIVSSNQIVNVAPTTNTTFLLSISNACGVYFDTLAVTVIPLPTALISGDSTICEGETIVLYGFGGGDYYWNNSLVSSSDTIVVTPSSTISYSLVVIDSMCTSIPFLFIVNVLDNPVVSIVGQDSICSGQTEFYSSQISGGQGSFSYSWSNGSISPSTTFSPTLNSLLSLYVIDQNGCSDSANFNIYSIPLPQAQIAGEIAGCAPLNALFTNLSTNANSFYWDFGDGNISQVQNPTNTFQNSGSYNVTLIAFNSIGCSDTISLNSFVTVLNSPIADISVQASNISETNNYSIINESTGADSCLLYFGDGQVLEGCNWQSIFHDYPLDGEYSIMQVVVNEYGCIDTIEVHIIVSSESTFYAPNAFTPGQNGKNDRFNVYGIGLDEFKLMIFDRWGELIFETTDIYEGWDGTYKGSPVELGVYVWKVDFIDKRKGNQYKIGHVTVLR